MTRNHGYSIDVIVDGEPYVFIVPASAMLVCGESRCPLCGADVDGRVMTRPGGFDMPIVTTSTRYKCGSIFELNRVSRGSIVLMYHVTKLCELSKGAHEDII